jgi:hypothetical protein
MLIGPAQLVVNPHGVKTMRRRHCVSGWHYIVLCSFAFGKAKQKVSKVFTARWGEGETPPARVCQSQVCAHGTGGERENFVRCQLHPIGFSSLRCTAVSCTKSQIII